MPDDIKDLFAGIPENAKICIWGAANAGRSIKEELAKYRQDTTVCAFIDSVKQGEIDGVKIYKPENMPEIKNNFDYMIISTRSDCTVIDAMLFYYDIKNYVRISPYLLKKYQFIPSKISEILNFLDSEKFNRSKNHRQYRQAQRICTKRTQYYSGQETNNKTLYLLH